MDKYMVDLDRILDDLEAAELNSMEDQNNLVSSEVHTESSSRQDHTTTSYTQVNLPSNGISHPSPSLETLKNNVSVLDSSVENNGTGLLLSNCDDGQPSLLSSSVCNSIPQHNSYVNHSLLDSPCLESEQEQPFSLSPTLVPFKSSDHQETVLVDKSDAQEASHETLQSHENHEENLAEREHELATSSSSQQQDKQAEEQDNCQEQKKTLSSESSLSFDDQALRNSGSLLMSSTRDYSLSETVSGNNSHYLAEPAVLAAEKPHQSEISQEEENMNSLSIVNGPFSVSLKDQLDSRPSDEELLQDVLKDVEEFEKQRINGDVDLSADGFSFDDQDLEFEDFDLAEILKVINRSQRVSISRNKEDDKDDHDDSLLENELQEVITSSSSSSTGTSSSTRFKRDIDDEIHGYQDDDHDDVYSDSRNPSTVVVNGEVKTVLDDRLHDHASSSLRFSDCLVDSSQISEQSMNDYLADVIPQEVETRHANQEEIVNEVKPVRPSSLNIASLDPAASTAGLTPGQQASDHSEEHDQLEQNAIEGVPIPENDVLTNPEESMDATVRVGHYKPFWIPDHEAPVCMHCDTRFTVIKRRHHCRACGKVLCASCCNMKAALAYMNWKEERVCSICHRLITESEEYGSHVRHRQEEEDNTSTSQSSPVPDQTEPSNPSNTSEGAFIPVGVLKRPDRPKGEPKQVVFSDGIRPGDLTEETPEASGTSSSPSSSTAAATMRKHLMRLRSPPVDVNPLPYQKRNKASSEHRHHRHKVVRTIIEDPHSSGHSLPAVINCPSLAANPTLDNLISLLESEEDATPVTFYLNKNLHVLLKITRLTCCSNVQVWSFASKGLATVGQDEVAFILERSEGETNIPRDVFRLLTNIYDASSQGVVHSEMSHVLFQDGLFGSKEQSGFLFVRPTVQCLSKIVLPSSPFLIALLIQRFEVPWAKVFPLRLILRLGAEFSCYPCPVVSYRQRKPAFYELGHTILNVLADFRNFQYTIPVVQGVMVRRQSLKKKVVLILPRNRFDSVVKILNQNNEHVLSFGGNLDFSSQAHFACLQTEEGVYRTIVVSSILEDEVENSTAKQNGAIDCDTDAISLNGDPKDLTKGKNTGASFIVFSGALKATSGFTAKMNIVEDGVLVQIPSLVLTELKTALRDMKDFEIKCAKLDQEETPEVVSIEWTSDDTYFNVGVRSPIDGRSLEGVPSVRVHNSTDYASNKFLIRWTEVFFIQNQETVKRDAIDPTKIAGIISQSLCRAMSPHLDQLFTQGFTKIGLRVSLDPDQVGYEVGSNGEALPTLFVSELDSALIPVITGNFLSSLDSLLVMELFFHVIFK